MGIDIVGVLDRSGINVINNREVHILKPDQKGLVVFYDGEWYIVYRETLNEREKRITIAHEWGHILKWYGDSQNILSWKNQNKMILHTDGKRLFEHEADLIAEMLTDIHFKTERVNQSCTDNLDFFLIADLNGIYIQDIRNSSLSETEKENKITVRIAEYYVSQLQRRHSFSDYIWETRCTLEEHDRNLLIKALKVFDLLIRNTKPKECGQDDRIICIYGTGTNRISLVNSGQSAV